MMEGRRSSVSRLFSVCGVLVTLFILFSCTGCSGAKLNPCSKTSTEFIKNSCRRTLYPQVCVESLSAYASTIQESPKLLAQVALSVSLKSARSTEKLVLNLSKVNDIRPREAAALMDCVETMGDCVEELRQSLQEMKHLGGPDFALKLSNIKTWVSAALTNEDTCRDGFQDKSMNGNIKNTITKSIDYVAKLTSNALALINNIQPSNTPNSP
ncbi:PREDICTED: 21 kDa protein-like [Nelumbo nucifera]|uniref:21 kDa protein-like n=1 Tax=Nelumbo nucifera TaxID=4432 RepID=A0A1U8ANU4_NELNU|nr:PREDICTED: 21 kDa protein-like [Nelumbo nucifera]